jgi:hypothetical protein
MLEGSMHPEGPATGQLDRDFRGFPVFRANENWILNLDWGVWKDAEDNIYFKMGEKIAQWKALG